MRHSRCLPAPRRHVEPRPKRGRVYCRTLSLERRVDSWLRLYNLSRTVSDHANSDAS
jgi:hypothetical protein